MNCTVFQRRLLSAEQPAQPAADVKNHLLQCPACRAWQRRLVQMERQILLLPVPPSTAKAELLQRIVGPTPAVAVGGATVERPTLRWSTLAPGPKERGLRKVSVAFALAAALLVFALGWWAWPHNTVTPSAGPVAQQERDQKKLDDRLARVLHEHTSRERLLRLADLAESVQGEAHAMGNNTEKLDRWARFYSRVVSQHLIEQARQLPAGDRPAVLEKIAKRLSGTESRATRKAAALASTAPRSAASFDQIALAAR
ncbi:MAG TPA: hypothetical protein VN688_33495, partial [Gemmataceae bacterium]|nr:hypothetical protein [Gemmataceae bacterium]